MYRPENNKRAVTNAPLAAAVALQLRVNHGRRRISTPLSTEMLRRSGYQ